MSKLSRPSKPSGQVSRRLFTSPKSPISQHEGSNTTSATPDILSQPCRNCGKSFKKLRTHLNQKSECMAKYDCSELDAAKKEREQAYEKAYRDSNKDKAKAYRDSRKDKTKAYNKDYKDSHKDELQAYRDSHKDEFQAYRDSIKGKQKGYRATHMSKQYRFLKETTFNASSKCERFRAFKDAIRDGWAFVCICCAKQFFKKGVDPASRSARENPKKIPPIPLPSIDDQVKELQKEIEAIKVGLFDKCIDLEFFYREYSLTLESSERTVCNNQERMTYLSTVWWCHTCQRHIKKGNMPPQSLKNGLTCEPIPEVLILNDLETTLIAKKILFMKISKLPVSRWSSIKDKTVNIPINDEDILETLKAVNTLPRTPDQAGLIPVQLKRKKSFANKVIEAFIDPVKLVAAVRKLKELDHPSYQDIDVNENYIESVKEIVAGLGDDSDVGNESI